MGRGIGAAQPGGQPALQEGFLARRGDAGVGADGGRRDRGGGRQVGQRGEADRHAAQAVADQHEQGGGKTTVERAAFDLLGEDQAKLLDEYCELLGDAGDRLRIGRRSGVALGMRGTPGESGGFRGRGGRNGGDGPGHGRNKPRNEVSGQDLLLLF